LINNAPHKYKYIESNNTTQILPSAPPLTENDDFSVIEMSSNEEDECNHCMYAFKKMMIYIRIIVVNHSKDIMDV
jgi:hypothetical protein